MCLSAQRMSYTYADKTAYKGDPRGPARSFRLKMLRRTMRHGHGISEILAYIPKCDTTPSFDAGQGPLKGMLSRGLECSWGKSRSKLSLIPALAPMLTTAPLGHFVPSPSKIHHSSFGHRTIYNTNGRNYYSVKIFSEISRPPPE